MRARARVRGALRSNSFGQSYARLAPLDLDGGGGRAVDLDGAVGGGVVPRGGIGTTNAKVSFFVELNPLAGGDQTHEEEEQQHGAPSNPQAPGQASRQRRREWRHGRHGRHWRRGRRV